MYSTSVILNIPRQLVVLNIGNSPRGYHNMYAKNLTLHKGVDNRIQFQFINQEQKPVDITDQSVKVRIISSEGDKLLLTKVLVPLLPLKGITELQITAQELLDITAQKCYYSLEIPLDTFNVPVFMDDNSGARGDITIVNSVLPKYVGATTITIPSHPLLNPLNPVPYYSNIYTTPGNPITSLQLFYTEFKGGVQIQGSTSNTNDAFWYDINDLIEVTDATTSTGGYTVHGFHPFLRLKIISGEGELTKILVR